MPEARIPTEKTEQQLQEMYAWYLRVRRNTRHTTPEVISTQTPEVFVAKPQETGGIEGLTPGTPDEPGTAQCDIYEVNDDGEIVARGLVADVFNLSEADIGQEYMLVVRDKFGKWFTVPLNGTVVFGKLDGTLSQGSSATLSVWTGTTLSDSSNNVTVYDWFLESGAELATGAKCAATWYQGKWYVTTAECPP